MRNIWHPMFLVRQVAFAGAMARLAHLRRPHEGALISRKHSELHVVCVGCEDVVQCSSSDAQMGWTCRTAHCCQRRRGSSSFPPPQDVDVDVDVVTHRIYMFQSLLKPI